MGEVTSLLAHEINQPLTAIGVFAASCIQLIRSGNCSVETLEELMGKIENQTKRASTTLHRMKSFVGSSILQLEEANINSLIQNLKVICDTLFPCMKFTVQLELDKKLPSIFFDKIQIEQVLLNIMRNSLEAMKSMKSQEPLIIIQTKLLKNKIRITVKDSGPGFINVDLKKLFNAYYTTKSNGIGIGLSICRTIIQAHGGKLKVKSLTSSGACVEFFLPMVNPNTL